MRSWSSLFIAIGCTIALTATSVAAQEGAVGSGGQSYTSSVERLLTPRAAYSFVSAEFMPLSEIEAALPLLASRRVSLVLSWPSTELENPQYYEFVRRANALGVEVRPWLLLPPENGYWANSINAAQYDVAARRLLTRWLAAGLRPSTLVVDMEMPLARVAPYAELLRGFSTDAVVRFLREGINRVQYAEGTRIYRALVDFVHSRGFRAELSTISQVVDDYQDGDDGLRQAFNIPVSGIDWDTYGIQVYRTLNEYVIGDIVGPTSAFYVYDYASRARAVFGYRATIGIGMVDAGEVTPDAPVYENGWQMREDLDAARAAGLGRESIGVYSLRGILHRAPSDQWFPQPSLFPLRPRADLATILTRTSTALIDAQL
jgi:hypothetical protein